MKLGMCAWVVLGALGCGGEPAVDNEVVEVTDTASPDTVAEVTDTSVVLPDATEVTDTASLDTVAEVTDTASLDTVAEVTDTASPDTVAEVTDTTSPDTTVTDTASPDTTVTDTASPDTTLPDITDVTDTTPDTQTPDIYTPLCDAVTTTYPVIPSPYAPVCSELSFMTDPPTSGPHYPVWATYKTYNVPVNPGFLVHSLKHGAIVITWRCPNGCLDELVELREMLNRRTADRRCDPLLKHRIIVAPRPDQDTMVVASAWGASWKAPCFDLVALEAFIDAHYGQGLEDECFEGVDVEKVRSDSAWYCPP